MSASPRVRSIEVRDMLPEDWAAVREIYAEGIATRQATFETETPDRERWDAAHLAAGRLIAQAAGEVMGWAALSPVSDRCVYGGVAEVSVYVRALHRGRGVGSVLLDRLVVESECHGIWTLQAGVFPENSGSVAMHERHGFRLVGRRERVGRLDGRWRDILLLERRSRVVGMD